MCPLCGYNRSNYSFPNKLKRMENGNLRRNGITILNQYYNNEINTRIKREKINFDILLYTTANI